MTAHSRYRQLVFITLAIFLIQLASTASAMYWTAGAPAGLVDGHGLSADSRDGDPTRVAHENRHSDYQRAGHNASRMSLDESASNAHSSPHFSSCLSCVLGCTGVIVSQERSKQPVSDATNALIPLVTDLASGFIARVPLRPPRI